MTHRPPAPRRRARPCLLGWALTGLLLPGLPAGATEGFPTPPEPPAAPDGTAAPVAADSQEERLSVYDRIEVRERGDDLLGIAATAAEGSTGHADLAHRPLRRAGDLVETVPGLIATQHSGGGKANQYFVRGFNLDHGTDFAIHVDGMPVNLPSHGHGQGYADLNFLIPELVDRVAFRKGPYAAAGGDFSTAGAAAIDLIRDLPGPLVQIEGGGYGYGRSVVADSWEVGSGDLLAAMEFHHDDGSWQRGDDLERANGVVRYSRGDASRGFSLTAMGYEGSWLATDQIPLRAVADGRLDRYGGIDRGPRGWSERASLSAAVQRGDDRSLTQLSGYLVRSDFRLFSNFTYFLADPDAGDQFEQTDRRSLGGLGAERRWLGSARGRSAEVAAGMTARYDDIANGLYRTRELVRRSATREDGIGLASGGVWAEATVHPIAKFRATAGLRVDAWRARVASDREENSGRRDDALLSPRLSLAVGPWRATEVYASAGRGFHSNDARGATLRVDPTSGEPAARLDPLVPAWGAELGLRTAAVRGLATALSAFVLDLDSELLFSGDGGGTQASRPSRRKGIEWTNHWQPRAGLEVDLDLALSRARFTDRDPAGDRVPGALERVVAAGLTAEPQGRPWFASLRLRYFAGYPLVENGSRRAAATALVDGAAGWRLDHGLTLRLEGFNLLGREDADATYFYASRLPGEPAGGVEDVHFHPVEKPALRLAMRWEG